MPFDPRGPLPIPTLHPFAFPTLHQDYFPTLASDLTLDPELWNENESGHDNPDHGKPRCLETPEALKDQAGNRVTICSLSQCAKPHLIVIESLLKLTE